MDMVAALMPRTKAAGTPAAAAPPGAVWFDVPTEGTGYLGAFVLAQARALAPPPVPSLVLAPARAAPPPLPSTPGAMQTYRLLVEGLPGEWMSKVPQLKQRLAAFQSIATSAKWPAQDVTLALTKQGKGSYTLVLSGRSVRQTARCRI